MSDPALVDNLAVGIFLLFVAMLAAATVSVAVRVSRWHMRHIALPVLLYRDLVTVGGLAISFFIITTARVLALPPEYTRTVPWIILTSAPAIAGMGVFLYFEFFVIGHHKD
jgi:hypothetical protein